MAMTEQQKKYLDSRTTAYIIKLLRSVHQSHYHACDEPTCDYYNYTHDPLDIKRKPCTVRIQVVDQRGNNLTYTDGELKQYLATRPHIKNKKESKLERQLKAKRRN